MPPFLLLDTAAVVGFEYIVHVCNIVCGINNYMRVSFLSILKRSHYFLRSRRESDELRITRVLFQETNKKQRFACLCNSSPVYSLMPYICRFLLLNQKNSEQIGGIDAEYKINRRGEVTNEQNRVFLKGIFYSLAAIARHFN